MTTRKVSNPLALAVLACISERPMHPYEVASTLRSRHADEAIKLNYGSLYSVIEALVKHGFITPTETLKAGKRPERTVYALTDAGEHELNDWLSELLAQPVREFPRFEAGLSLMAALAPDDVQRLLARRVDMLVVGIAQIQAMLAGTRDKKIARLFTLDRECALMRLEAELAWVRGVMAELAGGTLEGVAEWRRVHGSDRG